MSRRENGKRLSATPLNSIYSPKAKHGCSHALTWHIWHVKKLWIFPCGGMSASGNEINDFCFVLFLFKLMKGKIPVAFSHDWNITVGVILSCKSSLNDLMRLTGLKIQELTNHDLVTCSEATLFGPVQIQELLLYRLKYDCYSLISWRNSPTSRHSLVINIWLSLSHDEEIAELCHGRVTVVFWENCHFVRLLVTPSGGQICIKTIERGVGGRGGGEGGRERIHTHNFGGGGWAGGG